LLFSLLLDGNDGIRALNRTKCTADAGSLIGTVNRMISLAVQTGLIELQNLLGTHRHTEAAALAAIFAE